MIDMKYEANAFIKRIDRELNDMMFFSSIIELISDKFYPRHDDSEINTSLRDEFYKSFIEGNLTKKIIRKVLRSYDFECWTEWNLQSIIDDFLNDLNFKDGKLTIYRAITTNYDWIKVSALSKKIKLGDCWSYDYNGAIPYYGNVKDKNHYIFMGDISPRDIDWYHTILFNLSQSYSHEKEIRLFSNRTIKNFRVEKKGELFVYQFNYKKKIKS